MASSRQSAIVLGMLLLAPRAVLAQDRDYLNLKWWHPLVASAGVAATFLLDQPVHDFVQDNKTSAQDDIANVAKRFHEPVVTIAAATGGMAAGLVFRQMTVAQTGVQILAAYGLTSGMMIVTKWAFGRSRPSTTPDDNTVFDWFAGGQDNSFPSGAAAVTFSLATTLADAIDQPVATVVLYTGATLNSWARVYADRHWFSDVFTGALYGITAAKLVNGKWRLFGFRPPTVGIDGRGRTTLGYTLVW
jgi:membrane-associated phospholipid phosphatase